MTNFFSSRWCNLPDSVRELGDDELPGGFRASGIAAGIKPDGALDIGLLTAQAGTVSALRLTRSGLPAAPVLVTRERAAAERIRTVVVNSGNANAATGGRGLDEAARMQGAAAMATGVAADEVAVCSTGVIGVQLDGGKVVKGLPRAVSELRAGGAADFQRAIQTTDRSEKRCAIEVSLPDGPVRITAQCKGAGMIEPRMATLLCFVQTDARISAETADLLLGVCVKRSFERITVDGQTSTNDTVIMQASGASAIDVEPQSAAEAIFGQALDAVLRQLAVMVIADGEGAERIGRVIVRGPESQEQVEAVARGLANSPLVKTALNGADPNWGRILQTVGMVLLDRQQLKIDIEIEGVRVCADGIVQSYDSGVLAAAIAAASEIDYLVTIGGGGYEAEVMFSDLGHGYVTVNADYRT